MTWPLNDAPCWASGDHDYRGGGACVVCGHRLRCFCGVFLTIDGMDEHFDQVHGIRCPQDQCDATCAGCLAHEEFIA